MKSFDPGYFDPNAARGGVSSGYMQTICGKCKEPAPLGHYQIDFIHVCQYCFELHQISSNRLPCPYKKVKSRKLPVKPEPILIKTITGTTFL